MSRDNIVAVIQEAECIGCTKCIQACPVDAILGSNTYMHTVITSECIGCQLCIPPCPVDCIDLVVHPTELTREEKKQLALKRIGARKQRLMKEQSHATPKLSAKTFKQKQEYIQKAFARTRT